MKKPDTQRILRQISKARSSLRTPVYIYDRESLEDHAQNLVHLFSPIDLFYSMKANTQKGILSVLAGHGIGTEVTGQNEFRIAKEAGFAPTKIVTGGPCKKSHDFDFLSKNGASLCVLDSLSEFEEWKKSNANLDFLTRIRFPQSRFGMSALEAMQIASKCEYWKGLHFYSGSQKSTSASMDTLEKILAVIRDFTPMGKKEYRVQIGPGLSVPYHSEDSRVNDISPFAIRLKEFSISQGTQFSLELGRYLVGACGLYCARVLEKKILDGETWIFLDGGLNAHNPGVSLGRFFADNPDFQFVTDGSGEETVQIAGNLCAESDVIGRNVRAPTLSNGDIAVIPNSGAYCLTTALWSFNGRQPPGEAFLERNGSLTELVSQLREYARLSFE